jgi:hypothetical protein
VGIVNRRNAVLGWGVWKIGVWKVGRRVFRDATPSVEGGRPNRSFVAVFLASAAGALTFWRKRRGGSESS